LNDTVQPARNEDDEAPVPTAWRPTLKAIVDAFREGDFELARGIPGVSPVPPDDARIIAGNIEDYGDSLAALPEDTWETSVCLWMDGWWQVMVDLYTEDDGASDLVLDVRVRERGAAFAFEVHLVYVP
jgi:hypothetical protein